VARFQPVVVILLAALAAGSAAAEDPPPKKTTTRALPPERIDQPEAANAARDDRNARSPAIRVATGPYVSAGQRQTRGGGTSSATP
jgi:hypothetical protein